MNVYGNISSKSRTGQLIDSTFDNEMFDYLIKVLMDEIFEMQSSWSKEYAIALLVCF